MRDIAGKGSSHCFPRLECLVSGESSGKHSGASVGPVKRPACEPGVELEHNLMNGGKTLKI